ncbi:branched-chain amino acid ABC transporter permease [Candidatus Liberibacter solanacearum]|uniref:Branched-chain amino acid ABC transporter permease n=1 Tax=Candidatus Liberibacter solanacearum TaxID=556287 RepID=A0A1V2N787_9HYPH|nr:branched-chain amino acid ABC transporter permease [Candidatus Liberibacter solanacearum]ONI58769.1 branched-chain amino acid ABC transporter permease [Candidatus Liberibacter solanacearum]ONI59418.1 ABC transporter permease [Candidatus Liberibacter solanacearum]
MLAFLPRIKKYDKFLFCLATIYPLALFFLFNANKAQKYIDSIGIQALIYVMLAWGLSIIVGSAGLFSLNYVVAYAVGAYAYVILGNNYGFSPWLLLPMSAILSGACGLVLGLPSLKFRGDYLAIATFIISEIVHNILIRWKPLTNGKAGLYIADRLMYLGADLKGTLRFFRYPSSIVFYKIFMYYVVLFLCVLSAWIILRLRRTSMGNAWRTIKDNQRAFSSFNTTIIFSKLSAFSFGCMFAGVAGGLLAASRGYVSPDMFKMSENIALISIVILGGMTSLSHIAWVALIMISGMELLCGVNFYYFNSFLKFDCSFNMRHSILMIVSLFFVILLRSYSLIKLRYPSPFLDLKK